MVDITIGRTTFERLQRHAQPLVDTPDAVVNRALDALEGHMTNRRARTSSRWTARSTRAGCPISRTRRSLPPGSEVKRSRGQTGTECSNARWSGRCGPREASRSWIGCAPRNLVRGRKIDDGYHHLSEIDVSIQGLSANEACNALIETAQQSGMGLEITFRWRAKERAAYPTQTALLRVQQG